MTILKISARSVLQHKLRLTLTGLAIILGVACVSGTFITTDTINGTFNQIFTNAYRNVAVQVTGLPLRGGSSREGLGGAQTKPIPASVLTTVRAVAGVKDAVGVVYREGAEILGPDNRPLVQRGPPRFGGSWIPDPDLSPFTLQSGTGPQRPGDVVIDARTASLGGLVPGSSVRIAFNGGVEETFALTGIVRFGSAASAGSASIALFTPQTADRVMQAKGMVDRIVVSAEPGVTATDLRDRIAAALPAGVQVATGQSAAQDAIQSTTAAVNTFLGDGLLAFAMITLFVGCFLIVNTFNILVAQRTRELALLRALGATRRQILGAVLAEAALTGLVASALGSLAGILIAALLLNIFGGATPVLELRTFAVAIATGTVVTTLAALVPGRRATHIPPVAALREALPETQAIPRRRIAAGVLAAALGAALIAAGLSGKASAALPRLGFGALLLFLGTALVAPVLIGPAVTVIAWPVRRLRGVPGRLADENARRNPRRTSLTAAALMIGVALISAVAVLTSSIKASFDAAIVGALHADLFVIPAAGGPFGPDAAAALRRDPRLRDVTEVRTSGATVGNVSQEVLAIDPGGAGSTLALTMSSGSASSIATQNTVIVDSAEALARNLRVGDHITVSFPEGNDVAMTVGGVYDQSGFIRGYVVSLATLTPNVSRQRDVAILADAAPGRSLAEAEAAAKSDLATFPLVVVFDQQGYRSFIGSSLDTLLTIITALLGLAVVIAVLGIVNTLALSVLERTRELGLLRALGMTRGQMRSMVRWESVVIALIGAALGLGLGIGLGTAFVTAQKDAGLDVVSIPVPLLVVYAAVAGVFGVAAALLPAFRAARVDIIRAVTTE